jgi:uncharacterized membrane protein YuzA (DUF378 family)
MKTFATILLIIGGLNWLLVGLFQFDLVAALFGGQGATLSRVVYSIVGLCALYTLSFLPRLSRADRVEHRADPHIRRAA